MLTIAPGTGWPTYGLPRKVIAFQVEDRDCDAMERRVTRLRHLQIDDVKFWVLGQPLRNALPELLTVPENRCGEDLDTVERIFSDETRRRPNCHLANITRSRR